MDLEVAEFELRRREIGVSSSSGVMPNTVPTDGRQGQRARRPRDVALLTLILASIYAAIVLLNPWAIHMGARWTPLLIWTGSGTLVTASGSYPLMVTLTPSPHSSRLRLDGLRPTGGLSGWGWLCTPQGTTVRLRVSGTIYGAWRSTDGALMEFRLIERIRNFPAIQDGGYVDLFGYWRGPELAMDDRGEWSRPFRFGLILKHASLTLRSGDKSDFDAACAATSRSPSGF